MASLVVAHVHHGLQPAADDWLAFCEASTAQAGLPFLFRRLPARSIAGGAATALGVPEAGGLEAWARRHRYRALAAMAAECGAGIVLTAHHANDQLETVQLRRQRGAGPLGLGAMRIAAPLPGAPQRLLLRPFLETPRQALADYAAREGLRWIEDPSNQDTRHARNRVRRTLDESLARDPAALDRELAEVDRIQREADRIRDQARRDLEQCRVLLVPGPGAWDDPTYGIGLPVSDAAATDTLSRAELARLPPERTAETLRLWLAGQGLRMPSRAKLAEITRQLIGSASAQGQVRHDGRWLLRYRDHVDSLDALPVALTPVWFRWRGESLLEIAGQRFQFIRVLHPETGGGGIDANWLHDAALLLDRGHGADRVRLAARGRHRTWKNLTQQRGVPTWLRPALPVVRAGSQVLFAAPFGTTAPEGPAAADADGPTGAQVVIRWEAPPEWRRWL